MSRSNLNRLAIAACAVVSSGAAAAAPQGVLVVDKSGAGDFTEIQAAVVAAQDGDTILVRVPSGPAPFAAVEVVDKALTIAVDSATQLAGVRKLRVRDLGPGKTVVITRLRANPQNIGIPPGDPSIWLDHNAGSVRLASCASTGSYGDLSPGLAIESSPGQVAFADCVLKGSGGWIGDEYDGGPGGAGFSLVDGVAAGFDSAIVGGRGGDLYFGWFAGPGGSGAEIVSDSLPTRWITSNLTVRGGVGGTDLDCYNFPDIGAPGGAGLVQRTGATTSLLDTLLEGGAGGSASCGPDGPPGAAVVSSGVLRVAPGPHVALRLPTVGREDETIELIFTGTPGDRVFLLAGRATTFVEQGGQVRVVVPDPLTLGPFATQHIGRIGANGELGFRFELPRVATVPGAMNLWFQAVAEHADQSRTLGGFGVVTVLDSIY